MKRAQRRRLAVDAIRRWWRLMGSVRYPHTKTLTIPADDGGRNDSRVRLEQIELGKLANELGLVIPVPHLPPGTSKWNKIEHRLFSFITANWRGKPLVSHQAIVQLIAATTMNTGQCHRCQHPNTHPAGGKVSGAELEAVAIVSREFPARGIP